MNVAMVLLTASLFLATTTVAQDAPTLDPHVRDLAAKRIADVRDASLVIGIVEGDHQTIVPFGEATERTVYEIGSVTKTFTALLLADAVERGEVSLDEPVAKLLPGFTVPGGITLVDLATQTSGLPRLPENLLPKDAADPYADYTAERLKTFLAGYTLPRKPGSGYEYSNLGFGLLAHALATRAGISYGDLVHQRITGPLGMTDTAVASARLVSGHASSGTPVPPWHFDALAGAGALDSDLHDMLLYLAAIMKRGEGPLAKAAQLAIEPRRPMDGAAKIGLAWMTQSRAGREIVWHNGMTGGYSSFIGFTADGERGVVVLSNVAREVTDLGMQALVPEPERPAPHEIALTPAAAAAYAGRYRLAPGFDLDVRATGNVVTAQATGQGEFRIHPSAPDEFFFDVVDAQISFKRDTKGKVEGLVLHQNGRDLPASRVGDVPAPKPQPKEIALDPAALEAYVGRYTLAPGFALDVTVDGGLLQVQATGQPRLPVYPSAPDEFFYKVVDARLSFERDAAGHVVAVVLHQNGRDLRGPKS